MDFLGWFGLRHSESCLFSLSGQVGKRGHVPECDRLYIKNETLELQEKLRGRHTKSTSKLAASAEYFSKSALERPMTYAKLQISGPNQTTPMIPMYLLR